MSQLKAIVQQGVWKNNSALVQLLGLCPLLAVSTSVTAALSLGLATTGVLMATNFSLSLLRHSIPHPIRIPIYVLIIASMATTVQLLMNAFAFQLYQSLGIFIPLIVTNCIVIGRAEAFAAKQPLLPSTIDGLAMGLGATTTLLLLGSLRELLGTGSLFKGADQLFGPWAQKLQIDVMPLENPFLLAILPPGAFLGLGLLLALKQHIDHALALRRQYKQAQRLIPIVVTMANPDE